jgi:hypothetical protein
MGEFEVIKIANEKIEFRTGKVFSNSWTFIFKTGYIVSASSRYVL